MWFKLAGATFTNNLGTMDSISKSYMMDYSGLTGLSASPGSVSYASDSTPDATITFTVKSGYVFKSGSTVTASGGASQTYTASADIAAGSSFTMSLTDINNKVTFVGAAELVSIVNPEPETPTQYQLTIIPNPADATVTMNGATRSVITVNANTSVSWSVRKSGYATQTGTWTATENKTLRITLVAGGITGDGDISVGSELEEIQTTTGYYINASSLTDTVNEAFNIGKYDVSTAGRIKATCRQGTVSAAVFTNAHGGRTLAGTGNTESGVNFIEEFDVPYDAVYFELTYATKYEHSVIKLAEKEVIDVDSYTVIESESNKAGYYIDKDMKDAANTAFAIGKYNVSNYSKVYVEARVGAIAYLAWTDSSGKRTQAGVGNSGAGLNYKQVLTVPDTAVYLEVGYSTSQPCTVKGGE